MRQEGRYLSPDLPLACVKRIMQDASFQSFVRQLTTAPLARPIANSQPPVPQRTYYLAWVHDPGSLPLHELNVSVDDRTADDWC